MKILFTADLHLTDLPRDEHRWDLFPWLSDQARKHQIDLLILGGDITDAKNNHSAKLTNRLVENLIDFTEENKWPNIYILRGNHDYVEESEPFFKFLKNLPRIHFVTKPTSLQSPEGKPFMLFLPNTRDYEKSWAEIDFEEYDMVFCHQTFDGAESETGFKLPGIPASVVKDAGYVYSGDIHKPQRVGKNIEYVGSPYRIRFGDDFTPRVLMIGETPSSKRQQQDLHFPTKNKILVDINGLGKSQGDWAGDAREGDQVKVRVHLNRKQYGEWPKIRNAIIGEAAEMKLELTGPELVAEQEKPAKASKATGKPAGGVGPEQAVAAYAEQKRLPAALAEAGKGYLKQAQERN